MKKNLTVVDARFAIDDPSSSCTIKLDVADIEMMAWFDHADDKHARYPYMIYMKSGAHFFVTKSSGDVAEERWLEVKR